MLRPAEEKAIIITYDDNDLFSTLFLKYVNNIRPDIKIIHQNMIPSSVYMEKIKELYPDIHLPFKMKNEKGKKIGRAHV